MAAEQPKKILMLGESHTQHTLQCHINMHPCQALCTNSSRSMQPAGGTRFIGVYLARQLIEAGHEVTLLTRGKKPVTAQIPDDTDESFKAYEAAVKHIACDRTDGAALKDKLSGQGFQGACYA